MTRPLSIPSNIIGPTSTFCKYAPGIYTFTVNLTNFLGVSGVSSRDVSFVEAVVPTILAVGSNYKIIYRSDALMLYTDTFVVIDSAGKRLRSNISYSWTVKNGNTIKSIKSYSTDPSSFKLLPFSLKANSKYTITLTSYYLHANNSAQLTYYVSVESGDVVAMIAGGSSIGIAPSTTIYLDASSSYDENLSDEENKDPKIAPKYVITWTCYQKFPTLTSSCNRFLLLISNALLSSKLGVRVDSNGATSSVYVITVSVTDNNSGRSSQASVEITILPANAPTVDIKSSISGKINSQNTIKLLGNVSTFSTVAVTYYCEWTVSDSSINLEKGSNDKNS